MGSGGALHRGESFEILKTTLSAREDVVHAYSLFCLQGLLIYFTFSVRKKAHAYSL